MKIVGEVNKIHEKTKPRKLEAGETVTYRLLCGIVNPDNEQRPKIPILYPQSITIPSKDRIKDPNSGEYVDIAIVESFDKDKNVKPLKLAIPAKANSGLFTCTGGNIKEEETYEYCEITNFNKSNPNRDQSIEPLFERVDHQRDSKERSRKRSSLREALTYAQDMTDGDVKNFAASMNWNENEPIEILRDKVEQFAEKTPDEFVKHVENKDASVKADIKKAITAGKITYDAAQHRIALASNGHTLIKMDRVEGADYLTQAAEYVLHNTNGQKVYKTIKTLLKPSDAAE